MGACLSNSKENEVPATKQDAGKSWQSDGVAVLESDEEPAVVKEVLSETPKLSSAGRNKDEFSVQEDDHKFITTWKRQDKEAEIKKVGHAARPVNLLRSRSSSGEFSFDGVSKSSPCHLSRQDHRVASGRSLSGGNGSHDTPDIGEGFARSGSPTRGRSGERSPSQAPPSRYVDGGAREDEAKRKETLENPLVSFECFIFL